MKKASFHERLLKNKDKLKIRAVALALAVVSVIATGCGKANTNTQDAPNSGIEDIVDGSKREESMTPLTVENLNSEAEKLTNKFIEKGFDTSFDSVRSVLLHLNYNSFTSEEYYSLFDVGAYSQDPISSFFNELGSHNFYNMVIYKDLDKLINLKDFCRSADGYKVIAQIEDYSFEIAELICSDSKDIDGQIKKDLQQIFGLLDDGEKIEIGNETFFLKDLDDVTKTLIMYSCTNIENYIINIPDQSLLSDETKQLIQDISKFIPVVCCTSSATIYDSIYNSEFSKQE